MRCKKGKNSDKAADRATPVIGVAGSVVPVAASGNLGLLMDKAREYVESSLSANTRLSYKIGWDIFNDWREGQGADRAKPPTEDEVGLFLTYLAQSGRSVATIESRLAAISSACRDAGWPLDQRNRAIREVLLGIKRIHGAPQKVKEAILGEELEQMLGMLDHGVRGLRDRAILLLGFAGALRRSEIVGLDVGRDETLDGCGWIEIVEAGLVLHVKGKTGWREVAVGRGSKEATCPVAAVQAWMTFGRIAHGPLFRRIRGKGAVSADRLCDQQVARIVASGAAAAGLRPDLTKETRRTAFAGHSLRAGLATSVDAPESVVQKHLGHASPQMTRRYQRHRDRFRVNLTKASGL